MIYLIVGPDARTVRVAIASIIDRLGADALSTDLIDGRVATLESVVSAVSAPGFFGAHRVVIVEDLMAKASKSTGPDDGEADRTASKSSFDFARLFMAVAPGNSLLLVDRTLWSVPAGVKRQAPAETTVIAGEPPRGTALVRWMTDHARGCQSELSDHIARQVASLLFPQTWSAKPNNPAYDRPPDLDALANEIEKLASAAYPGPIEVRHVTEMTARVPDDRLFSFIDAVLAGEISAAALELASLTERGEEPARVSAQLFQQIELTAALASAPISLTPVSVGQELGLLSPQRMNSVDRTRRRLKRSSVEWVHASKSVDRQSKDGRLPRGWDALYALLAPFPDPHEQ